ncbi:hypothetical protein ZHAS_00012604 [Anopheles sinensis]|uniref:CUB domain-containing protein n=1 Tax=Anopheles sinensis TaxID=74873 RepID=A0A084W3B7_ANOSI|nr:hypothetical protein ZHAS_00012604 [Anopheles sinensis]
MGWSWMLKGWGTQSRDPVTLTPSGQDFRVLKILPSNLDVVEDIKQIGNEYYFKKDVEIVVDDSENEIIDGREEQPVVMVDTAGQQRGVDDFRGTTSDGSEQTETLDIVVLPAPTKDVEIYDTELLPTEATTRESEGDISVIGLITPTRMGTTGASTTVVRPSDSPALSVVETTLGHWDETGFDLPEQEGADNRTKDTGAFSESDSTPFSFNNRTFQNIQDTVRRQELDESQGPYPPLGSYDEDERDDEDDFDDVDDNGSNVGRTDHDLDGSSERPHKKYISVQRTQLNHPLHQGFLMTPSYPKYYIGESICRWTLHAGLHQRIKLTVLDLALRFDEECRDYLQVVDLNTNRTLFRSCTESNRLIEIVSVEERLEVALGCEVPSPTPGHMQLVRRTERRAKFVCDPLYVFPDTGESSRELICTAKHTWNRPLPACIGEYPSPAGAFVAAIALPATLYFHFRACRTRLDGEKKGRCPKKRVTPRIVCMFSREGLKQLWYYERRKKSIFGGG